MFENKEVKRLLSRFLSCYSDTHIGEVTLLERERERERRKDDDNRRKEKKLPKEHDEGCQILAKKTAKENN